MTAGFGGTTGVPIGGGDTTTEQPGGDSGGGGTTGAPGSDSGGGGTTGAPGSDSDSDATTEAPGSDSGSDYTTGAPGEQGGGGNLEDQTPEPTTVAETTTKPIPTTGANLEDATTPAVTLAPGGSTTAGFGGTTGVPIGGGDATTEAPGSDSVPGTDSFRDMDADGDGELTTEEIQSKLGDKDGVDASTERVQEVVDDADTDGDGTVSEKEYTDAVAADKVPESWLDALGDTTTNPPGAGGTTGTPGTDSGSGSTAAPGEQGGGGSLEDQTPEPTTVAETTTKPIPTTGANLEDATTPAVTLAPGGSTTAGLGGTTAAPGSDSSGNTDSNNDGTGSDSVPGTDSFRDMDADGDGELT